jgi:adenine-specific DNA-methyltransferase
VRPFFISGTRVPTQGSLADSTDSHASETVSLCMAKIEDLIAQIPDERLRKAIGAEVKVLKKTKKFGLVFEEHLPETVRLPRLAVKAGELVALKREAGNQLWRVRCIKKDIAVCDRAVESYPSVAELNKEFSVSDLVVVRSFGNPIYPALVPVDRVERGGPEKPWHMLINSDNFHALQLLLYCYEGKVDVIYIDPPYNSGARDWKYNNDYVDKTDSFRHSKWLSMMKKRLTLAKRLLRRDGVLIVTIDENEVFHLGVLLEQIFDSYLRHTVTVVINPKGTGKINFGRTEEHALFCVSNTGTPLINGNLLTDLATAQEEEEPEEDSNSPGDEDEIPFLNEQSIEDWDRPFPPEEADQWELRHARRRGNESSYRHQRWNQFYPIYIDEKERRVVEIGESIPLDEAPDFARKGKLLPIWPIDKDGNHRCWRFVSNSMRRLLDEGRLVVGQQNPKTKSWTLNIWDPKNKNKKVKTVWWNSRHDAGTHGTTLLHHLLGKRNAFPFPKSLYAVRDALLTVVAQRPTAVVLDFFAGSGTTAHAVALINAQLGGARRAILVSNNEPGEKNVKRLAKSGFFPADPEFEREGICDNVTWPRCKNAINGKRDDGTPLVGKYVPIRSDDKEIKLSDGFKENLEYFRLDFLDPDSVARGDAFQAILPILWMMAGCRGTREDSKGSQPWFIPKQSPFAVLIKEKEFRAFREKIADRKDIEWVFLVTDSEENFGLMRRALGRKYECIQLYKNYLENFRLNTPAALGQGGRNENRVEAISGNSSARHHFETR